MNALHVIQYGDSGQTVVLLHGFGGCGDIWRGVSPRLGEAVHVLAYDLPGHGGSLDFPGAGAAKLAARAILADLLERGIERVHVAGHSMGGAVAVLMALAAPQRIASLALLAPGGFGGAINGPLLRRYGAAIEREEIRTCLEAMSGPRCAISDDLLATYAAMRERPGQCEKLIEIAAAITRDDRQGVIPREMLASLGMPVTVAWGTDDPVLPVSQADGLPPAFLVRRIPGAGHMLVSEAPDLIIELIRANLARSAVR
jgi:pyruvate dehydrogenase E2 component (dihydrolipoamide acetyltransferase)